MAGDSTPAVAQQQLIAESGEAAFPPPLIIINPGYRLLIDAAKGTIVSFRSTYGVDRELLIPDHIRLPLFKVEFMNDHAEFKTVTSSEAKTTAIHHEGNEEGQTITIEYGEIGELPVDARVAIRCPANETLTYWNLELKNGTNLWIGHVQFPVVEVPYRRHLDSDFSHILSSQNDGALAGPVWPTISGPRDGNTPEMWPYSNYPGPLASTQLLAHYNGVEAASIWPAMTRLVCRSLSIG